MGCTPCKVGVGKVEGLGLKVGKRTPTEGITFEKCGSFRSTFPNEKGVKTGRALEGETSSREG